MNKILKIKRKTTLIFRNKECIALIVICFYSLIAIGQTTYYIDNTQGLDSNNGTSELSAWQSIDKVNATAFSPGDQILFKSGQEFFGKLIPSSSGNNTSVITFGSYGGATRPVINGKNYKMCIDASEKQYLTFKDLILKNDANEDDGTLESGADRNRYGFFAHVLYSGIKKNITLHNLKIHKIYPTIASGSENSDAYKGYGIYFTSDGMGNNNFFDNIIIEGCEITDIGYVGISVNKWIPDVNPPVNQYQKNINISNNNLHHIGGSGIVFFNVDGFLIENNISRYTGDYSLDTRQHGRGSGFWSVRCKNGILQFNEFSHVRGAADSCGAHIDIENDNIIVQYNLSYDNAGGFAEFTGANTNCIYRYNVSINDGARVKWTNGSTIVSNPEMYSPNGEKNAQSGKIIWFSNFTGFQGQTRIGSNNNHVYNNTIYVSTGMTSRLVIGESSYDNTVKNNIFYIDGNLIFEEEDLGWTPETPGFDNLFDTNLWYGSGSYPNISSETLYNNSQNDIYDNPQLTNPGGLSVNDYLLLNSSPAIDAGLLISNNGDKDFFGNMLSSSLPTDIGAHEFNVSLGVSELNDTTLKVYPNPTTDKLHISNNSKPVSYIIYSMSGQEISTGKTSGAIDISNFETGMYILEIKGSRSQLILKK